MTLLKGLQHAQACLGETRCSDRDGHALAEKALAAAIAAEESAPAVVTADEVHRALRDPSSVPGYTAGYGDEAVAVLVNARIAAAVAAARAEERASAREVAFAAAKEAMEIEREECARVADEHAAHERVPTPIAEATRRESLRVAAAIRARGQSEAPAPERLRENGAAWQKVARLEAEIESLHAEADRLRAREARVQALVEAAEGVLRWLDTSTGLPSETALRAALDALGKEGAP